MNRDENQRNSDQPNLINCEEGQEQLAETSFIFNICYDFGLLTLVNFKRLKRLIRKGFRPLLRLTKKSPRDLSLSNIKSILNIDGNSTRIKNQDFMTYVPQKPKVKAKLNPQVIVRKAAVCIAPLMAVLIFVISFQTFNVSALALEVELNGKVIGIVDSESTFGAAFDDVYNRIADEELRKTIDREVSFAVVRVSPRRVRDVAQIQENILEIALPEFTEATVLHVDGNFVTATENATIIRQTLDEMLNDYKNGEDGEDVVRVQFYNDIVISKGFYLESGLAGEDDVKAALQSPIVEEETVTIDAPATVVQVAQRAAACPDVILEINPELKNGGYTAPESITITPGTEVVVSYEERPLLTIKSIRNVTLERNIPYQTVETPYGGLLAGRSRTTTAGSVGSERVTEEIIYVNGIELNRNVVSSEVLREPTTKQVLIGTYVHTPTISPTPANAPVEIAGQMRFSFPVDNVRVSSRWGAGRGHRGWDFLSPIGTNIYAAADGVVTFSGSNRGYGNFIIIDHGNGYSTLYAHNRINLAEVGQRVVRGEKIGEIGMTGHTTGPHVHFEIRINGSPVDPARYFN